jgi:hypothetical protein
MQLEARCVRGSTQSAGSSIILKGESHVLFLTQGARGSSSASCRASDG